MLDPANGRLTGNDTGPGRLPEPTQIFEVALNILARRDVTALRDLAGRRVVVSAGGTREALDPVRFLGNRSSGKQGYALAAAAAARGADVDLVAANVTLDPPPECRYTVSGRRSSCATPCELAGAADAVVMAAAPADFRPARPPPTTRSRRPTASTPTSSWSRTPTSWPSWSATAARVVPGARRLRGRDRRRRGVVLEHARAKLARKGCDLLVVNDVSGGGVFGARRQPGRDPRRRRPRRLVPRGSKAALAHAIWDVVSYGPPSGVPGRQALT